ncbi:helix-turn-helix transcriptional regulator [Bradyrhizobium sp. BRP14]|nr:helix-turn-helix transcriptional regulator [Bradyrhizobium sp. BRP14]
MPTEETKNDRKSIDLEIGSRIRATREVLGVSQQSLAAALGVTYQQIHKYEQGINRVSAATFLGAYFPHERPSADRTDWLQEKLLAAERKLAGVRRALRDEQ